MSVVIAQVKQENDADFLARIVKNINGKVKVMSDDELEDYLLEIMADEAEEEGGIVSRKKISKFLKKNGIDF